MHRRLPRARVMAGAFLLSLLSAPLLASGLRINTVELSAEAAGPPVVSFTLSWENSWHNAKNHDAVWIFVDLRGEQDWNRARMPVLSAQGAGLTPDSPVPEFEISDDRLGVFVQPAAEHRGPVRLRVELALDRSALRNRDPAEMTPAVFGIEMVEVPSGAFTLGDPDPAALAFGAFYASDSNGEPAGLVRIESERQVIPVGPQEGHLYYRVEREIYQGDRHGPVPETFPKGYERFYVMKYEITQGQYAQFLNNLTQNATYFRTNFGGRGYYKYRGSIRLTDQGYVAASPQRPANYISWDDGIAFADWAGLRPMTEFEFTKSARGPGEPIPHEFPWGTPSRSRLARRVMPDDNLVTTGSADESHLNEDNRDVFGASYYWVMDLAGSVWERVVSAGHPTGRAFAGSHGDGRLTGHGFATNADWPRGDDDGGGYGYRGGGNYEHGTPATEFNPWSPIAYRTYGAWGAAPRYLAYGFRAVRSAP